MTRINTIDPDLLSNKHLNAEYRELPRIFTLAFNALKRGESPYDKRNPSSYVLGKGHVRFFYNKLRFLAKRQERIIQTKNKRGFKSSFGPLNDIIAKMPTDWVNDWTPSQSDHDLNLQRLVERDPKFYKK